MRIFICNFNYFPRTGGHEVFAHNLANQLSKEHDITLVTRENTEDVKRSYNLEKLSYIDKKMKRRPSFAKSLKRFIEKNVDTEDMIIANDLFSLKGTEKHVKKIYIHHGFFHEHEPRKLVSLLFKPRERKEILSTSPRKIICVNENDVSSFPSSIFIPVGVDMRMFRRMKVKKEKEFIFLSPKNFYAICGVREIAKAFSTIENAKLIMAGEGPLENELRKNDSRIIFPGKINHWEMPKFYNKADCVVFNVKAGIQRTALLEALACGKPVIASRTPPFDGMVNESNGLIFEDDKNLAGAMNDIMNKKYNSMNIRDSVKDYDWSKIAKHYIDIIETL